MAEHTPTPWGLDKGYDVWAISESEHGWHIGIIGDWLADGSPEEIEANAAFIVRACNSHDRLVEALSDAQSAIKSLAVDDLGMVENGDNYWSLRNELLHKIGTALADARGDEDG